jgi:hypothetical protein
MVQLINWPYTGVSEIRVLILTIGRTRQIMKHFSNILQNLQKFFAPQFLPNESFCLYFFCNHENFNYLIFSLTM